MPTKASGALKYAESIVAIEKCVAVESNLVDNSSRIFAGKFAATLGLRDYDSENSIRESRIPALMSEAQQQEKFIAELRFFHYLKRVAPSTRDDFYLRSQLRFCVGGRYVDVDHRMYYVYDGSSSGVVAAICLYGPA